MKNVKAVVLSLVLIMIMGVAAGCGPNDKQATSPQKSQDMHAAHSMPSGDPMPMMKDMDKNLQDMVKQVKVGQMMDAQKSASQIASLADKVMPHMNDNTMREQMKRAAYELRDTMNDAKVDQTVIEAKLKAMQDIMGPAMKNLQSGAHTH